MLKKFELSNIEKSSYHDLNKSQIYKQKAKNSIEKEFKFKVDRLPEDYDEKQEIKQYYLSKDALAIINNYFPSMIASDFNAIEEIRVRFSRSDINGDKIYLTLKSGEDKNRREIEREITFGEWEKLSKFAKKQINKSRYVKKVNGFNLEFDEYTHNETPLYTCEVETDLDEKYPDITQSLDLLGIHYKDVTELKEYKNAYLSLNL